MGCLRSGWGRGVAVIIVGRVWILRISMSRIGIMRRRGVAEDLLSTVKEKTVAPDVEGIDRRDRVVDNHEVELHQTNF